MYNRGAPKSGANEYFLSDHLTTSKDSRPGYPESLLIYHAGVGRTVFIGCLRITTIILFVASCGVLVRAFQVSGFLINLDSCAIVVWL